MCVPERSRNEGGRQVTPGRQLLASQGIRLQLCQNRRAQGQRTRIVTVVFEDSGSGVPCRLRREPRVAGSAGAERTGEGALENAEHRGRKTVGDRWGGGGVEGTRSLRAKGHSRVPVPVGWARLGCHQSPGHAGSDLLGNLNLI